MLQSIIPTPLHPAIVHLPIALTVLLPLFAVGAFVAVRRGVRPISAWGLTTAMAAALALSSWVAVETGEGQEDKVERVVSEAPLESHEEAAETFLVLSAGMVLLTAAGLTRGKLGTAARAAGVVASLGLAGAGWNVGRTGGALVYEHGAASAYTSPASTVVSDRPADRGDDER